MKVWALHSKSRLSNINYLPKYLSKVECQKSFQVIPQKTLFPKTLSPFTFSSPTPKLLPCISEITYLIYSLCTLQPENLMDYQINFTMIS